MVFLLSVCGPPAPRIEEPLDGEEYTGNRCSQQFVLDPFYPAVLALILRTPTESERKSPRILARDPRGRAVRRSGVGRQLSVQRLGRDLQQPLEFGKVDQARIVAAPQLEELIVTAGATNTNGRPSGPSRGTSNQRRKNATAGARTAIP